MLTYEHHTLRLLGFPVFSLVLGAVLVATLAELLYGVPRWAQAKGRFVGIASMCVWLLVAVVIALVCLTVWSGSMG